MSPELTYQQRLDELFKLEFTGMKLGLDNIRDLLATLDNPHRKFNSIHVAGSNGKGSVSAMLAAALQANGYKVGLYTSPHLVDFRERVKINGKLVPKHYVSNFLKTIWNTVEELQATFFEVTTALAFQYFADEKVDVAIIETGLGGRLDATNALEHPLATVVTSISLEHTQFLGNTLEAIAGEKAGIFKKGSPAIVNVIPELRSVFSDAGKKVAAVLQFVDHKESNSEMPSALNGSHQESNLQTVLTTLSAITLPLDQNKTIEGIQNTIKLTGLRARLEDYPDLRFTSKGAKLILDVGHNPDAFKMLAEYFIKMKITPIVILGLASDKDRTIIFEQLHRFATKIICVQANTHRAVSSIVLTEEAATFGFDSIDGSAVLQGITIAIQMAVAGDVFLLCGSHFVVGEYLKEFNKL
ncbi:MAG TPA: folylpolyglutamate synthase/dihydrofolate synthase family protein [Candidatus Kapabacteria bacterium]|nr:folylpolyglutamate synthase/dihydrofolate synthase family protein [Candidatus Kapabacteria bacterium]